MAVKKVKMSSEGLAKFERELEYLITIKRAEVAQKLKEARAFGDLSENAEYDEAKNEQGILEARIQEMEYTIANAEVVEESDLTLDEVGVGSLVTMRVLESAVDMKKGEVLTLRIVGSTESNPEEGKVSDESPIGLAAMAKRVGDTIDVEAPGGVIRMEITEIGK
jgi:transcription elongation factor GreA